MHTPWDSDSVKFLNGMGVEAFKVASADLTNLPLIKQLIDTKKPLILSTGIDTPEEIQITINFLNKYSAEFILLHCNKDIPCTNKRY